MFRERRWRFLLNVINHLERTSQTREAMVQDEELLERVFANDSEDDDKEKGPRFSEWSPETEALYMVVDRLGDVCSGLVGLGGQKPKRIKPLPRPKTAVDRVKNRKRLDKHAALVARVLPPPMPPLPPE